MKLRLTLFLLFMSSTLLVAQKKRVVHGYVKDAVSGEALVGAAVFDFNK